jgi:hypothetical protein
MKTTAKSPKEYLESLPEERRKVIAKLRNVIRKNLPKGFKEVMNCGMIGYVIPHSLYPPGYHCDPEQPLPFMNISSQKNHVAVYNMAIYADKNLLAWFTKEYQKQTNEKLSAGKSCLRFTNLDQIPYELIAQLAAKVTPQEWIKIYEKAIKR